MARKSGKYDDLIPKLHKLPPSNTDWQSRVDEVKSIIKERHPLILAENYIGLRQTREFVKAKLTELELQVEAHEQLLESSQEAGESAWGKYGVKPNALRLSTGDTIRIQKEPTGKVVDKEMYRLWCLDNGYERQLQLWPSTTNAIIKERLLHGDPEPDGTEAYFLTKVVLVKKGDE